jgi:RimJ/RimL family protein N-acetyltransferase
VGLAHSRSSNELRSRLTQLDGCGAVSSGYKTEPSPSSPSASPIRLHICFVGPPTVDIRFRFVTTHTLTDGVLVLNPLSAVDAPEWLAGEDEEQRRWFEAPRPAQLSDVEEFIASCQESWRTMGDHRHWGIRRVDSPFLLGGVDLRAIGNDQVNLSYLVFPQFRRNGVARRATKLALHYASTSMGAKTAIIKMLRRNVSSHRPALGLEASYLLDEPSDAGGTYQVLSLNLPLA